MNEQNLMSYFNIGVKYHYAKHPHNKLIYSGENKQKITDLSDSIKNIVSLISGEFEFQLKTVMVNPEIPFHKDNLINITSFSKVYLSSIKVVSKVIIN